MFVWTAIYIESQLEDLRDSVLRISEENGVRCPLKFLPLHVSLKISFDVPRKRLDECIDAICEYYRTVGPFTMEVEGFELNPGIIWVRMKENQRLAEIHAKLDEIVEKQFGIAPHEFDKAFIYHCTLLTDETEKLRTVMPLVENLPCPSKLYARSFLIGISEDGLPGTFMVYKHSHLGSEFSVREQWEEFDKDSPKNRDDQ